MPHLQVQTIISSRSSTPQPIMSLLSLPLEILLLIIDNLSKSDRFSLFMANKQLSQIVQPSLFRRFSLRDPAKALKCIKMALARPDLALAARDVLVSFHDKVNLTIDFWKLFAQGLCCMSNITSLHFAGIKLSGILFRNITLPRLQKFSSIVYVTPEVSDFLCRHTTITQLFIGGEDNEKILDVRQGFLPSLKSFMGSVWVAEKVIPTRPVADITLAWISSVDEERTMSIIKSFSLSSVRVEQFYCTTLHIYENRLSLLRAIAQYLPHLRLLRMNSVAMSDRLDDRFIDTLVALLPRFKHLERLIIPSVTHSFVEQERLRCQEDNMTVEWKKICPRLVHITFPSCNMYDYDATSGTWKRAPTVLSQSMSIFNGVF